MKTNIRKRRLELGMTQIQVAKAVGTSQQQIGRIEDGQSVNLDLAVRLCATLKSPIHELFPSTKDVIGNVPIK